MKKSQRRVNPSIEHDIPGGYQLNALLRGWRFQRAWHRSRLDLVHTVLPPPDDALVLDAACGSGILTWRFKSRHIVATDMRLSACEELRAHTPGSRSVVAMLEALPFSDESFARVYLLEVLEHLAPEDGIRALGELRRVCKRGGKFLLMTPNYHSHWVVMERALDLLRLTPPMASAQHVAPYTRRRLMEAATRSGWTVRRLGSFNLAAPLLGTMSSRAGTWAVTLEAGMLRYGGALLFAVCERADV